MKNKKKISENYPIGAQFDKNAPWNKDDNNETVIIEKYDIVLEEQHFVVVLSNGQKATIDFEDVIEIYFKKNPNSFENFNKMFPESDESYKDIVKFLYQEGYDFTPLIQDVVDYKIDSENLNAIYENKDVNSLKKIIREVIIENKFF